MDETWVFAGMSHGYDWVDKEALRNPYEAMKNGLTTGLKTPVSRGKRAIVIHCVAEDGLVDGANFVFASHATDDDGDYHRDMDAAKIALEHGVIILRLPPYHCDLNPIESVWGWIKRQLRDELWSDDKLKAVMAATKLAFKSLPQSAIRGIFSHVREAEKRYAALDELLLDDTVCELVPDAATFVDDSYSEAEVEVDVME
uniref:Tc1-like transposase DDE domain-containing protein n=1 Tax=Plectus sambesii TaxID=2011161 RepID=A0A914VC48_9BILA